MPPVTDAAVCGFGGSVAFTESGEIDSQGAVVRGEEGLVFCPVVRRPEAAMNEEEGFFAAVLPPRYRRAGRRGFAVLWI